MSGELTSLGVDHDAERLYRRILRAQPAALTAHVAELGWTAGHGRSAYRALVDAGLVTEGADALLLPEPPRLAIGRLIQQESALLETRRRELEDAQAIVADLAIEHQSISARSPEVVDQDLVPRDQVVTVVRNALTSTVGPIRHSMMSTATLPARDEAVVRLAQAQVAQGRLLQTVYPAAFLRGDNGRGAMWVRDWADVGEQQRLVDEVPHAFTVFGDELVLACTQWGAVTDDLVAVRAPMLVLAFIAVFDASWQTGLPVPQRSYDADNDRLLAMLASGLKDEAIARYLGVSLRTVRRRVAQLMDQTGAHTRFQLGSAAERRGLLGPRD